MLLASTVLPAVGLWSLRTRPDRLSRKLAPYLIFFIEASLRSLRLMFPLACSMPMRSGDALAIEQREGFSADAVGAASSRLLFVRCWQPPRAKTRAPARGPAHRTARLSVNKRSLFCPRS